MNYEITKPTYVVNVLGTDYSVFLDVPENDDPMLGGVCSGYCDKTAKRIVVVGEMKASELDNWSVYRKECLRHELIHAFMFESGIDGNMTWDIEGQEHPEGLVGWLAIQFPKIVKAFREVGAL